MCGIVDVQDQCPVEKLFVFMARDFVNIDKILICSDASEDEHEFAVEKSLLPPPLVDVKRFFRLGVIIGFEQSSDFFPIEIAVVPAEGPFGLKIDATTGDYSHFLQIEIELEIVAAAEIVAVFGFPATTRILTMNWVLPRREISIPCSSMAVLAPPQSPVSFLCRPYIISIDRPHYHPQPLPAGSLPDILRFFLCYR